MEAPMKKILTAAELARLRGCTRSYIARLCRLPEDHPKYIKNVKLDGTRYMITDEKILAEILKSHPGEYCSVLK